MRLIRFERLRGIHIIIIFTWVQNQIGTLTFINIVSLSFLKTKFQNQVKCNSNLVLHCVTLVTSVTFVTHVTSVTSVTCSIRKFHQSKYISTPLLNFLIYSGSLTNISSLKESRRILPKILVPISAT